MKVEHKLNIRKILNKRLRGEGKVGYFYGNVEETDKLLEAFEEMGNVVWNAGQSPTGYYYKTSIWDMDGCLRVNWCKDTSKFRIQSGSRSTAMESVYYGKGIITHLDRLDELDEPEVQEVNERNHPVYYGKQIIPEIRENKRHDREDRDDFYIYCRTKEAREDLVLHLQGEGYNFLDDGWRYEDSAWVNIDSEYRGRIYLYDEEVISGSEDGGRYAEYRVASFEEDAEEEGTGDMERYEIEKVVQRFKRKNDVQCRITDPLVEHIVKLHEAWTTEQMLEVIDNAPTSSIYNILNGAFMAMYFGNKAAMERVKGEAEAVLKTAEEVKQQIEEQQVFQLEREKSTLSLGLVEKALARVMMDEYAPALAEQVFANAKDRIEQEYGKLQKKIEFQLPEREGKLDEVTHEEFETVLSFVMANEPVMLVGSAGTGKNVICKQVAKLMNLDFYFSNAVTQEYKLTGFIDAHGVYQETEFYKAFKHGGLFMLDEIDASIPEVLVILNAAIANRYFDFPNGKIEAHENFRVVAAGNTYGLGASYQYVGRNQLDAASLDRFAQVEIEYSPAIENSLTTDVELLNFIRAFRKECAAAGINHIVSYRTITRLDKMANVMPVEKALKTCLIKNMEQDDLRMISRKIGSNCGRWKEGLGKCVE